MIDAGHVMSGAARADRALLAFVAAELEADGLTTPAVAIMGGALDAIERILREYLRAGDRIAVEDPGDPSVVGLVSASALIPTAFAVDEAGPRPDAFEEALRKGSRAIIVTPRAQNPIGAALTGERATQLQRILRRFPDVVLIEHDGAAAVAGAPMVTLRGARGAPWAFVRSTSTFLGPDLRIAIAVGDEMTMSRVMSRQALGVRWVSHLLQRLALALWADPANGRRFARAAALYAARRQALRAALAARGMHSFGESGLNVWVPVAEESVVVRALAERGWAVAAGERFRLHSPPAIRITSSTLDPVDAARLARDLAAVLRPLPAVVA
jgi:DNA-binding transcriptional MocR family regulator